MRSRYTLKYTLDQTNTRLPKESRPCQRTITNAMPAVTRWNCSSAFPKIPLRNAPSAKRTNCGGFLELARPLCLKEVGSTKPTIAVILIKRARRRPRRARKTPPPKAIKKRTPASQPRNQIRVAEMPNLNRRVATTRNKSFYILVRMQTNVPRTPRGPVELTGHTSRRFTF